MSQNEITIPVSAFQGPVECGVKPNDEGIRKHGKMFFNMEGVTIGQIVDACHRSWKIDEQRKLRLIHHTLEPGFNVTCSVANLGTSTKSPLVAATVAVSSMNDEQRREFLQSELAKLTDVSDDTDDLEPVDDSDE
jgi:hypothetical protein